MQLKEKPELHQINQKSEALVKTYQPDRPIKEPKSVARVDRTNLQPLKEPKSVAKVDRQPREKLDLNQINQKLKVLVKTDRTNLQPLKEPKSVAKVDRTNLQPLKEPKSVAKVDRTNLQPLKEPKSVAKVDRQPREKLDLNQINQKLKVLVKTDHTNLQPIKEPKSVAKVDRTNLQPIKEPKSVAKTYQPYFYSINECIYGRGTSRIIEFFVVVIIIGILAQIALPSFLHCSNKAMQSEAKQYVGSMNRAQQAYFAEKGAFSNSVTALGLGIKTQTTNYNYSAIATKNAAFSYGVARSNNLRSYVGAVFLVTLYNEKTTKAILCEATSFGKTQPANPILQNDVPVCAAGTEPLTK
jgi:type IV pilus assembly protein PilA